jgi:hypothetical protein
VWKISGKSCPLSGVQRDDLSRKGVFFLQALIAGRLPDLERLILASGEV